MGKAKVNLRTGEKSLLGAIITTENQDTNQFAGFVLRKDKIRCGRHCFSTQVPGVTVCPVTGTKDAMNFSFNPETSQNLAHLQLVTSIGFLHTMTNFRSDSRIDEVIENLCKVELASLRTRLHAIAGGDNPYALLCLLYTSPSPRDKRQSRMPSSA